MKTHTYQVRVNGHFIDHVTKSAPRAHRNYRFYVPGKWYNYPSPDGRIQSVELIRDGEVRLSKYAQY